MRRLAISLAVAALLATTAGARDSQRKQRSRDHDRGGPDAPFVHPELETRTIDGSGNNAVNPAWGAADTPLLRITTASYADGAGAPAGADRPSARAVSSVICAQEGDVRSAAGVTDMVWQWGQFVDHDIDLTPVAEPAEPFDVVVPVGDPWFDPLSTGAMTIALDRSYAELLNGVRTQFNDITAFIDASNVYGSNDERARALRTLDGSGRLKTSSGHLLPFNDAGLPNAPSASPAFFLAGDFRANEQVALTALHTLFVREHNYWARLVDRTARSRRGRSGAARGDRVRLTRTALALAGRQRLSGDEIYEIARAIVGAEMQSITYREFLPVLLGEGALGPYEGYLDTVDPGISNVFATAAYRVGHTMLSSTLRRIGRDGESIEDGDLPLLAAFFNPAALTDEGGIEPLLRGLCAHTAQEVDPYVVDDVRNFLFGPPGAGGFDLPSLNIQRGRDHGLPSFSALRIDLGLSPIAAFGDISTDLGTVARLAEVYGDVTQVDAWVGGLAEDHAPGALVGETFQRVLLDQFRALRDGDRFWYERHLTPDLVEIVEAQTLARIIRRNTRVSRELPDDVWHTR